LGLSHFDHINQMIPLTMITFSGFHCIVIKILISDERYLDVLLLLNQAEGTFSRQNGNSEMSTINMVSIWTGWASAFGISIVGNFQNTSDLYVHLAGAIIAFWFACAFMWTQVSHVEN
jgi:hypothetical protein